MAPAPPATRRPPSRATNMTPAPPAATAGRMTRNRAVKEAPSTEVQPSSSTLRTKPSGLLARGKEGLRNVSDKMKNKEKEPVRMQPPLLPEGTGTSAALQAFLRIRPPPTDAMNDQPVSRPYLEPQGDKEVLMRAPIDPSRPHLAPKAPLVYSFDHVYPPSTSQSSFFSTTTLPLVERLLQGENALMFAFGVSNSGKSYTISGGTGNDPSERGLLPRSIDVIFNSIKGLESEAHLRCHALADIEFVKEEEHFSLFDHLPIGLEGRIEESVKVDRNYSYAVFVSYVEVYNEKIFDLLDAVLPSSATAPPTPSTNRPKVSTSFTRGSSAWAMSSMNLAALANGGGGIIRRQALALKNDPEGSGKYIAGLKEIRVRTREEALAIFRAGQRARQVFGTLANRESSRSHGVFTTKIVKIHNGAPNDPESAQVSRLSIVDLAGSERTRNTGTTGDRLKEAGNINKSLMVLGQCLEVLRSNQQRLAVSGPKKKLAMVPFRHSKLTEIFQNFFVGDGRAVMIVNVNPYDTGFDENSHVMRFSAIAREVQTTASNKVNFGGGLLRRQISTQFSALKNAVSGPMKVKVVVPVLPKDVQRVNTDTLRESDEFVMVEEELEVVEEDADEDSEDERDALVDHLFEQLKELKEKLFESEMRNAAVESEVREEAAKEMQDTIQRMHDDFTKRLQEQVNAGQVKTDRKIDILSRTIATPGPTKRRPLQSGQTFLASTPDIDMDTSFDESNDASFESAIDESLIVGTLSPISRPRMSDVTDPFVTGSPLRTEMRDEEDSGTETEEEDGESGGEDEIVLGSEEEESKATARAAKRDIPVSSAIDHGDVSLLSVATEESEDVLGDLTPEEDADASDEDDERTDEDSQEDDDSEDGDEEEEDEDVSDSSFAESEEADQSISSASPSPVRRQSTKRRGTVSPKKRATPASAPRTHSKVSAAAGASHTVATAQKSIKSPPLSERTRQDSVLEVSDEEMLSEPVKSVKKKRTLGKKIVMEDDMFRDDAPVRGGANIKRMTPKKVLR